MTTKTRAVQIPRDLVNDALARWEDLERELPALRVLAPRRGGAGAIRAAAMLGLSVLSRRRAAHATP